MVQLQSSKDEIEAQGLKVVGLSYDSEEIVKDFAERHGIEFPLLADEDSSSLEKLGLVNPEGKGMTEGVAFPGIIYLNSKGLIQETFFEDSYVERPTPGSVLGKLFGNLKASEPVQKHEDFQLLQTGSEGIAGSRWEVVVEFPLPEKAHLYAPGNESYIPVQLSMEEHPLFEFGEVRYPESEQLYLEAIGETVPAYSDKVRLSVPVTVRANDQTKSLKEALSTELVGTLQYQICTDKTCFLPQEETVTWKAGVKPLDRRRAPEGARH